MAADLDHRSGRVWRNLQDTADGVPSMQNAPHAWQDYRRPLDYYDEDVLNWLWADVIIRQQTKGAKSLDDFCKLFYGAPGGPPMVKTYTFDDVVNALNQVAPQSLPTTGADSGRSACPTMARARRSPESKEADGNWCTTSSLRNWIAPRIATER